MLPDSGEEGKNVEQLDSALNIYPTQIFHILEFIDVDCFNSGQ
jgi:hypothetical protein